MFEIFKHDRLAKLALVFFILISGWWAYLFISGTQDSNQLYAFAATYGLMCVIGGIAGFRAAKEWGGLSSVIGKAIIALSVGLFAQEFGQIVFSYFNIVTHVEIPYPSLADVGFFGSVVLYIIGIFFFSKAAGSKFSLKSVRNQLVALTIPVFMLIMSYLVFLKGYEFDWSNPLPILLDFGYPFGEAIYISIAILTYGLSRKLLGGVMRNRIMFIIVAFIAQYVAEANFLTQNLNGTWVNGGYGDYLYFISYFIMTIGLLRLNNVLKD
ncbi:hypothetical protein A2631_03810 [Candidatus Daviesbacteria bacterium RIFCSPHIGHO2_01_FULL_44_29]|uniref:Histidine kinase N-terminal 7TM region domain-containing protein n=1 Tax=Candidatus Daviesbacteria bacterium RIFCSPHIGHO2_02_FULL_43_12 TaxID=1797776 RepID=A0A1F5KI20_9BACT|nr:MAG: hypothetical protein A2631_03810 [Candidatus Daviesbacteria bacterium RIFCSPHIGHO2_01_FULL_44_29]OGE40484.1 MAG: hypothetical protein A3D25_00270 [Candidatus Daviesbacteria bacterium RIFCSPHIGHO2_02_FULL_43_12]OGE70035.1 MAG: hypothetical protein A3B55_05070 [Candidatus Daviesbacteria bacterium RIFCSPLOWO2_01_FULL_43_15]